MAIVPKNHKSRKGVGQYKVTKSYISKRYVFWYSMRPITISEICEIYLRPQKMTKNAENSPFLGVFPNFKKTQKALNALNTWTFLSTKSYT